MQIAAIERVASPPSANRAGREPSPVSAFEELLHVAQAAGNVGVQRRHGTNVALGGTAVPVDARADRLSSMKADDRASRTPTGSRISGSQVPSDADGSRPEGLRAPINDQGASSDQTTPAGGEAHKSQQTTPQQQSTSPKPASSQPATTDQRVPAKGESPPIADGNPRRHAAGAQGAEATAVSAVSSQERATTPSPARIQATRAPVSTVSAQRVVGTRSAAQLRDATPSRTRPAPAVRQAREVIPKRPEQRAAIDRIVKTVQAGARGKETVARIELDPPALGHVRVRMHLKDDTLQVRVTAETDDARRVLTSQVDELRSALEQQGVKVQRLAFHGPGDGESQVGNRPGGGDSNSGSLDSDAGQASTNPSDGGQHGRDRQDTAKQERPEMRALARAVSESGGSVTEHVGELRLDVRI